MDQDALEREALISLARLHHDRFVLIGGGALHLLHGSPRGSADLDLVSKRPVTDAEAKDIASSLQEDLSGLPSLSGRKVSCRASGHDVALSVDGETKVLLQFTPLPAVPAERRLLTGDSLRSEIVAAATLDALLLCKATAFLKRPSVKGRDAFDIWFLQERAARLDEAEFDAWRRWEELDASDIKARIAQLTPRRLTADLSRYLPKAIAGQLEEAGYQPLLEAVERLYRPWLED